MSKLQYGFTLIELLAVLGILSLLLALVPPMLNNVIDGAQLKNTKREIISALRFARSKAVASRQPVTFAVNLTEGTMTVDGKNRELSLPADVRFTVSTAPSEQLSDHESVVRFYPDGSSTGGQLRFQRGDRNAYIIDVNWLTGRVTGNEE